VRVPIFLYHCIGSYPNQWHRATDDLKGDLETLYSRGYRSVRVEDVVNGRLDLAETPKPFGFRFDDNTEDQFRVLDSRPPGSAVPTEDLDEKTLVGILERFKEAHPDFGTGGIFYLCAHRFRPDGALFGQPELQATKLRYLLDKGYELGNHTYGHEYLSTLGTSEMRETIAKCDRMIESLIGDLIGEVRSFAYPFADVPDAPEKRKIVEERFAWSFVNRAGPLLYPCPPEERHVLPRVTVTRDFDMGAFLDQLERDDADGPQQGDVP
jgi:peptidoglycan/xylan/chitin deacetylase (PgdA/CDA1 family)